MELGDGLGASQLWFVPAAAIGAPGLLVLLWVALQTSAPWCGSRSSGACAASTVGRAVARGTEPRRSGSRAAGLRGTK
jgi:hypothetical protein